MTSVLKANCFMWLHLQSDLQENQKKVGEMEAELQKANNKVCNMGHMLSQLSIKVRHVCDKNTGYKTLSITVEEYFKFLKANFRCCPFLLMV